MYNHVIVIIGENQAVFQYSITWTSLYCHDNHTYWQECWIS